MTIEDARSFSGKHPPGEGFEFVLTMRESLRDEPSPNDFVVGNAVLVGDLLAITVTHCLLSGKDHLWVRSAQYPEACAKVIKILWPDGTHAATGIQNYLDSDTRPEDIVGLVLDKPLHANGYTIKPVPIAEPTEEKKWNDMLLALAAPSRPEPEKVLMGIPASLAEDAAEFVGQRKRPDSADGVTYFTFVGCGSGNGAIVARGIPDALGYPLESGAAILSAESLAYGKITPKRELRGLQISAPGLMPPPRYADSGDRFIGILPLDNTRKSIIDSWKPGEPNQRTPERIGGPRRFAILDYRDGHVMSGSEKLVEIQKINDFANKKWRLYAVRAGLGMLRTGLKLCTDVENGNVKLHILNDDEKEAVPPVVLYPAGISTIRGCFWLYGRSGYRGKVVHYYLFFLEDFAEGEGPEAGNKRIRLAVFDADGPHVGDRPEYHLIQIEGRVPIGDSLGKARSRSGIVSDDDRVQDDVGNGHEGHDPP